MPRRAKIHYVSLRSSLVNLPISIYGPLLERNIRPQNLAVHLSVASKQNAVDIYVGWTGMASASSLAHFNSSDSGEKSFETIEIDPQYAQSLGLAQGDVVEIGLIHDLPMAKSVATEPLTSDDWEIIEINASHVESTLLSQVRVASVGQEIDVWVLGRTRVRLRVVSLDPPSKNKTNALLLTTNTEVSIAPKLRRGHPPSTNNQSPSKSQTNSVGASSSSGPKLKTRPHILRVLPARVLVSPPPIKNCPEILAYVSSQTFSQIVQPHFALDKADKSNNKYYKCEIRRLTPPTDPHPLSSSSVPPPAPPAPKILNPHTDGDAAGKPKEQKSDTGDIPIYIGILVGIPNSHVVFPAGVEGIGMHLEEWDSIKLTVSADKAIKQIDAVEETTDPTTNTSMFKPFRSATSFLAGVDEILAKCQQFCLTQFTLHAMTNDVLGVSSLLVTGRTGAGKTSIVQAVAKALQENPKTYTYTYYVDLSRYSEKPVSVIKALLNYWYDKATYHKPTILILDNMDKLLGAELEHADSFRTRHITELFLSLYSSSARSASLNSRGIILLGTAESTTALHPLLSSLHLFSEVVHVKPPNKDARRDILAKIVQERLKIARDIHQDPESPLNFTALATMTEGYSATDLQDLVARAVHQVAIRSSKDTSSENSSLTLTSADFDAAQVDFVPLSLRDINLQKSDVAWSDIGGLHDTRRILRETLEWPTKYGPIFKQSPLRLRSGLLLYGYPGCGKTLLASAVARECGLNFISVKGPEILNKYIGASEKSVRDLFERASAAKPCVLFFDEFDSIAPKRGHDSTGVTDRVVNQMLTQMDGAEGLDGVYVLAATSRPDLIDAALLRPGRLDKSLLCDMPNLEERKEILQAVRRKVAISPSVDLDEVAKATDGYSGADLQALIYNAHLEVVHASIASTSRHESSSGVAEDVPIKYTVLGGSTEQKVASRAEEAALQRRLRQITSASQTTKDAKKPSTVVPIKHEITSENIRRVLKTTRPSVSPEERERLSRIYRAFVSDRTGDLPVPPESGGVGTRVSLG